MPESSADQPHVPQGASTPPPVGDWTSESAQGQSGAKTGQHSGRAPIRTERRQILLVGTGGRTSVAFTAEMVKHPDVCDPHSHSVTFENIRDWRYLPATDAAEGPQ